MASVSEQNAVEPGHHVVQFYEGDADLLARAGGYLNDAAHGGAVAVVIATEAHREAFEAQLRDAGLDVGAARDDGTLVWLDAAATLARFMPDGCIDRAAFFDVIGGVMRRAGAGGRPVRAYGEMVALLWEAGDVMAAIELERLWNELATEVPFSLYCAYRSESVSGHEHADALHEVCHLHTDVLQGSPVEKMWTFAGDVTALADARRVVTDALRRAGHDGDLLTDAELVISELAANAILHARSPFWVSVQTTDSTVSIQVRDRSTVKPVMHEHPSAMPGGRGLRMVAELASRWGVELAPDGKVVWAELGR